MIAKEAVKIIDLLSTFEKSLSSLFMIQFNNRVSHDQQQLNKYKRLESDSLIYVHVTWRYQAYNE